MPEDMSEYMPEDMSDRMPEDMSEYMPEDMPDRMPEDMSDRVPEDMPDRMPEDLPDRMPEDMPEDMPDHMPEDMPDRMSNRMSEDMSDRMPEDLPVRKCISVMVGITRSKVIYHWVYWVTALSWLLPSGNQTWQSWLAGKSRISRISGSFKWTIIIKMGNCPLLFLGLRKGQQTLGKFWGQ